MEKIIYSEDTIFNPPTGASYHDHLQDLRYDLERIEIERDHAINLLQEITEVESKEELEDSLSKIRKFIEENNRFSH